MIEVHKGGIQEDLLAHIIICILFQKRKNRCLQCKNVEMDPNYSVFFCISVVGICVSPKTIVLYEQLTGCSTHMH
jgi:hypothetical protein